MKQNIFDVAGFFESYWDYRGNPRCPTENVEKPAVLRLVGDVQDRDVLDIGSGDGAFAMWAARNRARTVTGIDLSQRMCERAGEQGDGLEAVTIRNVAVEEFQAAEATWDLVVSSLTLHYVEPLERIIASVAHWLRPCGVFVCSVNHPYYTQSLGAAAGASRAYWDEGPRPHHWFVDGVVKYHRTIETYWRVITRAGLRISTIEEPSPPPFGWCMGDSDPVAREIPLFVILRAEKSCS